MNRLRKLVKIVKALRAYLLDRRINQVNLSYGTVGWSDIKIAFSYLIYPERESSSQIVREYELAFTKYNGCSYAFSFLQGRVALSACLDALALKKGDKVVIPAYTCVGVANSCWIHELDVKFCDIELDTYGLSFHDFRELIARNPGVRAVIVQHLFGIISRDFEQVIEYCKKKKIFVIEDCAHATGASFKGKRLGNFGDVAFFSSEQSKVFNTLTGGIAITNDEKLASRLALFQRSCLHPQIEEERAMLAHFIHGYFKLKHRYRAVLGPIIGVLLRSVKKGKVFPGERISTRPTYRYFQTFPSCLAAIGINQLKELPKYTAIRRLEAKKWEKWCQQKALCPPLVIPSSEPVYLRYPVLVDSSEKQNRKWARPLQTQIGVWFISYLHPIEYEITGCPNAKKAIQSCINFPTLSF